MPLAMQYFSRKPTDYIRLPADKAFAEQVASVYRQHGCWSWRDDWIWFDDECFMEAPPSRPEGGDFHLSPQAGRETLGALSNTNHSVLRPTAIRDWRNVRDGQSGAACSLLPACGEKVPAGG